MKFIFCAVILAAVLTVASADLSEEDKKILDELKKAANECRAENFGLCVNEKMGNHKNKIDKVVSALKEEIKKSLEEMKKFDKECDADPANKVDYATVDRIRDGTATEDDKIAFGKQRFCVNVKMGLQKSNGDYEIDNIKKFLEKSYLTASTIDEVAATCGTRPAASSAEKAASALFKCVTESMKNKNDVNFL